MKQIDLIRHLRRCGCEFLREVHNRGRLRQGDNSAATPLVVDRRPSGPLSHKPHIGHKGCSRFMLVAPRDYWGFRSPSPKCSRNAPRNARPRNARNAPEMPPKCSRNAPRNAPSRRQFEVGTLSTFSTTIMPSGTSAFFSSRSPSCFRMAVKTSRPPPPDSPTDGSGPLPG